MGLSRILGLMPGVRLRLADIEDTYLVPSIDRPIPADTANDAQVWRRS